MALSDSQIDKILKGIHSGEIDIDNLPDKLSEFTYEELIVFVERGFGKLSTASKVTKMGLYETNISAFSGAKTFQQVKDLTTAVFQADGSKRPFKEFREFAQPITEQYNKHWLKTEQDTAFAVAQNADRWDEFEADKELFPYLTYQTAADERVRDEHAAWDNITKKVDDSFWDTRMPPNGFNCRCDVISSDKGKETNLTTHLKEYNKDNPDAKVKSLKNPSKQFSNNPGKENYIFDPEKHPYFKHTKAEGPAFKKSITWQSKE